MILGDQKEITLGGLTSSANDYDCKDGDLMVAHNLTNSGSGLKGIVNPETVLTMEGHDFTKLIYVHHTSTVDVYIAQASDGKAYYCKYDGGTTSGIKEMPELGAQFTDGNFAVSSVGNTLVVNIEGKGLFYLLWKNSKENTTDTEAGYYNYLGQTPPDIGLEFELAAKWAVDEERYKWSVTIDLGHDIGNTEMLEGIMGTVNKQMDAAKDETLFTHPFFVRYAYRMYDGTFCNLSAPIYMLPCDGQNPQVILTNSESEFWGSPYQFTKLFSCALKFRTAADVSDLDDWKDVISGVCVFVSPQILNWSETGEAMKMDASYTSIVNGSLPFDFGCGVVDFGDGASKKTSIVTSRDVSKDESETQDSMKKYVRVSLFEREEGEMKDWVEQTYTFNLLKEINMDDIGNYSSWTTIERKGGITNLTTFEQLKDAYEPRTIKEAAILHTYNGRLNIADMKIHEKETFPIGDFSCYAMSDDVACINGAVASGVTVFIEENGQFNTAGASFPESENWALMESMPGYFFYPNANAKYARVVQFYEAGAGTARVTGCRVAWLKLKPHPYLNGAYYYDPFYANTDFKQSSSITYDEASDLLMPSEIKSWEWLGGKGFERHNYIYTSEVDNPFTFAANGVNAIGSGKIVTIKTSTKATSEGTAFGTQPLYAFCTDGIWALEVGTDGVYAAKQPVSRETLVNNQAFAALGVDNSILFLSDRGLMSLQGGTTQLLSGSLTSRAQTINAEGLPKWATIARTFYGGATSPRYVEADDFLSFVKGARLAFDYVNYRCIVFRTDSKMAYVYDAVSELWTSMDCSFVNSVEDYPGTLVSETEYEDDSDDAKLLVKKFTADGEGFVRNGMGFYVTRPMKLESPDVMKTVRRLIERNVNVGGGTKYLVLYGSRDLANWQLVAAVKGSSIPRISGTPYRFLVVAGFTRIAHNADVVSRLTMETMKKYTDRIR